MLQALPLLPLTPWSWWWSSLSSLLPLLSSSHQHLQYHRHCHSLPYYNQQLPLLPAGTTAMNTITTLLKLCRWDDWYGELLLLSFACVGNCKFTNSWNINNKEVLYSSYPTSLVITPWKTIVNYSNQDIDINTVMIQNILIDSHKDTILCLPFNSHTYFHPASATLLILISISIIFPFQRCYLNRIIQNVFFWDWLLFIHIIL